MIVSYEVAVLTKKKGFDQICLRFYSEKSGYTENITPDLFCSSSESLYGDIIFAPQQSELQKWLREKHNIHISIYRFSNTSFPKLTKNGKYQACIGKLNTDNIKWEKTLPFVYEKSYEEALEKGLLKALNLIENV